MLSRRQGHSPGSLQVFRQLGIFIAAGTTQLDLGEADRFSEINAAQISAVEVGVFKIRLIQGGEAEDGARQVGVARVGSIEVGACQIGTRELRAVKVGAA